MLELLAVLSASAAGGLRIALPLLLIGLLKEDLWEQIPLLSHLHPQLVVGLLVSWSLFELFASKKLLGQRILQLIQLVFSPIVGSLMGITIILQASASNEEPQKIWLMWLMAIIGGLLALVLQLVQIGWFYRLRGLPLWAIFAQDFLCVALVLFALDAPQHGGIIALMLLWLAIRSSSAWYQWYWQKGKRSDLYNHDLYQ